MANKIYTNHSLEEYNKKYGNKNLKKVNKVDADNDPKLLQGKSWWLINDTYYEIPTGNAFITWWHNLGRTGQIVLCSLLGVAVTTAIVVPIAIGCNNNKTNRTIDIIGGSIKNSTPTKDGDNLVFELICTNDKNEVINITSVKVGNVVLDPSDYTYDKTTHKLTIKKSGLDKGGENANISIEVVEKTKGNVAVTSITISAPKDSLKVGETLQLSAEVKPADATNKEVTWRLNFPKCNDEEGCASIDEKGLLTAKGVGLVQVYATSKDGGEVTSNTLDIDIEEEFDGRVTEEQWKAAIKYTYDHENSKNYKCDIKNTDVLQETTAESYLAVNNTDVYYLNSDKVEGYQTELPCDVFGLCESNGYIGDLVGKTDYENQLFSNIYKLIIEEEYYKGYKFDEAKKEYYCKGGAKNDEGKITIKFCKINGEIHVEHFYDSTGDYNTYEYSFYDFGMASVTVPTLVNLKTFNTTSETILESDEFTFTHSDAPCVYYYDFTGKDIDKDKVCRISLSNDNNKTSNIAYELKVFISGYEEPQPQSTVFLKKYFLPNSTLSTHKKLIFMIHPTKEIGTGKVYIETDKYDAPLIQMAPTDTCYKSEDQEATFFKTGKDYNGAIELNGSIGFSKFYIAKTSDNTKLNLNDYIADFQIVKREGFSKITVLKSSMDQNGIINLDTAISSGYINVEFSLMKDITDAVYLCATSEN